MKTMWFRRLKERKGFTLAELLTVVGILAITASIGLIAFGNTRKDKTAMANDEIARQIYMVAQNRMLQMKEYGEWGAVKTTHPTEGDGVTEAEVEAYYGLELKDGSAQLIPSDFNYWKNVSGVSTAFGDAEMHYLYSGGTAFGTGTFLDELIPEGSLEDGAQKFFIIEYDIKTATVYGVFYSDEAFTFDELKNAGHYYGDLADDKNGRFVGNNEASARNIRKEFKNAAAVLGYFGGGMISELTYQDIPVPDVIVYNGEDLVLHIENNYSGSFSDTKISVAVKGEFSGTTKTYEIKQEMSADWYYCVNPAGNAEAANYRYLIKTPKSDPTGTATSFDFVLDSFGTVCSGTGTTDCHFKTTFAGFAPGEDLEITVTISPVDMIGLPGVHTVKTNSLFASVSDVCETEVKDTLGTETGYTHSGGIEINAFRHLMNLNSSSSGAVFDKKVTRNSSKFWLFPNPSDVNTDKPLIRAYLSSSISFDGKGDGCLSFMEAARRNYKDSGISYTPVSLGTEVKKFYFSGKTDDADASQESCRIYDLNINAAGGNVGLFGKVSPETVISDVGIVQAADGNETVYRFSNATADTNVGAFVGHAEGALTLDRCYSTVLIEADTSNVLKTFNIGGLTGRADGNLTVRNSYVSGRTDGGKYTLNGRTGAGANARERYNISFHAKANTVNAGSLAGWAKGAVTVDSCYSTASIGNRENTASSNDMTSGTFCIGGLVGKTDKTKALHLNNSYFYAWIDIPDTERLGSNVSNVSLGGLIGRRAGTGTVTAASVTGCTYIEEYLCISDVIKTKDGLTAELSGGGDVDAESDAVVDLTCFSTDDTMETYPYTFDFNTSEKPEAADLLTFAAMYGSEVGQISSVMIPSSGTHISADDTKPYDSAYTGAYYPYEDVTGLGHHYGDWSTELPLAEITLSPGVGVSSVTQPADVTVTKADGTTETRAWTELTDGGWKLTDIPAGTEIDMGPVFSSGITLKDGFEGKAVSRSNSKIHRASDAWKYTARAIDAELTVNAGSLAPLYLYCPVRTEANTEDSTSGVRYEPDATANGNYRRVFGYQDIPLKVCLSKNAVTEGSPADPQVYDPDITLCFIWSDKDEDGTEYTHSVATPSEATRYGSMCAVTDPQAPGCTYGSNIPKTDGTREDRKCADMSWDQFTDMNSSGEPTRFLKASDLEVDGAKQSDSIGGHIAGVKKQAYYGYRQYQVSAYAYVAQTEDGEVRAVNWLRTALSEPVDLSAALNRVPVSFIYDPDSTIANDRVKTTSAKNMFGRYQITVAASTTVTLPTVAGSEDNWTGYIEYEDGSDTDRILRIYENDGVTGEGKSAVFNSRDAEQQKALPAGTFPTAAFHNGEEERTDIVFRGWQDAGTEAGSTDINKADWNWEEFDYEETAGVNSAYGPDVWYDDHDTNGKADGSEMLVLEKKEGETGLTANTGVKDYINMPTDSDSCLFRPTSLTPIKLKARWWRGAVPFDIDPNGGYFR